VAEAPAFGSIRNLGHHARLYAQAGFEVFPVNPTDKSPLVSQYEATTDDAVVAGWWAQWPSALIGHRISEDNVLLDVDPRHDGGRVWAALRAECQLPVTRGHMSGRGDGGGHIWWLHPGGRLSVTKLDAWAKERGLGAQVGARWTCGIDILHHNHRYTILPPSPHPETGQPYVWIEGRGIDILVGRLPGLIADLLSDDTPEPAPLRPLANPQDDSIADWYSHTVGFVGLLGSEGWTLRAGDGESDGSRWRHPTATTAHSATVRHGCLFVYSSNTPFEVTDPGHPHGYTPFAAFALLHHGGDLRAAASAARELKDGPGAGQREDWSWLPAEVRNPPSLPSSPPVIDIEPRSEGETWIDRLRAAVLLTPSLLTLKPPEHVIDGYLNRNSLAMLYGPSGGHKTFLAIDWALHVATGSRWQGCDTEAGSVLYIIAEGVSGMGIRVQAWGMHAGLPDLAERANIFWLPLAVNIGEVEQVDALRVLLGELTPSLVVVDTLARCTVGLEENHARDMGIMVANLDILRRTTGACILLVHHSGKNIEAGARGSSALRGAMDTEIETVGMEPNILVKVTKQKDGFEASPRWLSPLRVGPSLVLVPANQGPGDDPLSAAGQAAMLALRDVEGLDGVSAKEWRVAAGTMAERTFYRARATLVEAGLVANLATPGRPRYKLTPAALEILRMADS